MKSQREYKGHFADLVKTNKGYSDNTIYTFDIETSSYLILDGKQIPACKYLELSEKDQKRCIMQSNMYIWQFSINNEVYYGRTWDELKSFLIKLNFYNPHKKIVFVHNLRF